MFSFSLLHMGSWFEKIGANMFIMLQAGGDAEASGSKTPVSGTKQSPITFLYAFADFTLRMITNKSSLLCL